ncbi:sigma-54 interaction domain-containing protein [Crassaminicella profunda]|uniref:sigma-54 interaction domain-containing protein n=1 Tax=Crassaminicella profunda TaxID=1286698 RepID=UPI001CA6E530|nr:sigma 54-interacting transcriptional regulator [Crassaminicella profunda]QZY57039.1 sigma 54-interacting transcriptional regulator [Crassaminicella profunda]
MKDYTKDILETILEYIDEGVHVIDNERKTILYNRAMTELEGMKKVDVLNKDFLEVFPTLDQTSSTLLKALNKEEKIIDHPQTYMNNHNKEVTTINTTVPIFSNHKRIGALEISKNITKIKHLSDQIMSLQIELSKTGKKELSQNKFTFSSIIGSNKRFTQAIDYAKKAAKFLSSVLIYGETGTGKELVAQSIHYGSNRAKKPFLAQNCAAIPETLLEGILFGTVKGGFTGAINRPGLFEQASGGTVFLDEINSMGMQLQSKLLRVLQEGTIRRVGGLKNIPIDIRIIASTNEEPYEAIEKGKIRKDLFYRINVIPIYLPPLRERVDDIEILAKYFVDKYNQKLNKKIESIDLFVLNAFKNYKWPGNVRELENIIEGAMNIVENESILKKEHFSPQANAKIFALTYENHIDLKTSLPETLEKIEKNIIIKVLKSCNNNISRAALELGIKRQTLQHKLRKYKIITK